MNRPGTPLSVASEKRMSMPGVIMAAHAIIGTVLRKFPLGGTLSYSNWTFQLLRMCPTGSWTSVHIGWSAACLRQNVEGRWVKRVALLLQSPRILRQPRSPRGRHKAHGGGLQLLNGTSQGRPAGMAAHSLDVAIGGGFDRVSH